MAPASPGPSTHRTAGQGVGEAGANDGAGGSGAATGCQLPYASWRITGGLLPSTMTNPRWNGTVARRILHLDHLRVARHLIDQDAREPCPVGGPLRRGATSVTELIELPLVAAVRIDDPGANRAGPAVDVLGRVHRAVEGQLLPVRRPCRVARTFGQQTLTGAVGLHDVDALGIHEEEARRCTRRPPARSHRATTGAG